MTKMIVVFDLDDTMYHMNSIFDTSIKYLTPSFEYNLDELYKVYREEAHKLFTASQTGEITMDEMRIMRITNTYKRFGINIDRDKAKQFDAFYYKEKENIQLNTDTISCLTSLKEMNIPTGIITNGEVKTQTNTMKYLSIEDYFDPESILISGEIGIDKPHKEIFEHFETMVPNEGPYIYVGDNFNADIVGATKASWIPIWYNPLNKSAPNSTLDFYEIQSLDEVPYIIESQIKSS